jgi:hypothetical protein
MLTGNLYYTKMILNWLLSCKIMVNGSQLATGNGQLAIEGGLKFVLQSRNGDLPIAHCLLPIDYCFS